MPGKAEPSPHATYRIDSDLPELLTTTGTLYTTADTLPSFAEKSGRPVAEAMRHQVNHGFKSIDGAFEVFLYHLSQAHAPGETRRIVVVARNRGAASVVLKPRQSMFHGGNAGNAKSVESRLCEAVMLEQWDRPVAEATVAPGQTVAVGWTKALGATADGGESTPEHFVTGILRCDVAPAAGGARPDLEVAVVALPGGPVDPAKLTAAAEAATASGARSGEDASMDLSRRPEGCEVRRVVGTSTDVLWRGERVAVDADSLTSEGLPFRMALYGVQAVGCEAARQSVDMLLYPPYVHPDSVGNYMMEYHVSFALENHGPKPRRLALLLGKDDAPVGLAYQVAAPPAGAPAVSYADLAKRPVSVTWAGKGRAGNAPDFEKAMTLNPGAKPGAAESIDVAPGTTRQIDLRLMVVGTSSLPYFLRLAPAE